MEPSVKWYIEKQVENVLKNLEKRRMKGYFVADAFELTAHLKQLIPEGHTVGIGDSMTLFETGVVDFLREGPYRFLDKYASGITREEKQALYRANFSADTFITGTNAVTEAGELFNIDGNGSRVAPMLYGPRQVIVVVGRNKLVRDMAAAEQRVRQYAAPIDAKRLGKKTPCAVTGRCVDCNSPERICNDFVSIRGQFDPERIKVLIVDDVLGY